MTSVQAVTVVTGAAGFIGSNLVKRLLADGFNPKRLVLVDQLEHFETRLATRSFKDLPTAKISFTEFFKWLEICMSGDIAAVHHIGASSSTEEFREDYLREVNTDYTKMLWQEAIRLQFPFVYASSAATYGDGSRGFSDDPEKISQLKPLNPYGWSKQNFDLYALAEARRGRAPKVWAGLKFFNVYGPGEDHKGSQANVVFHATNEALDHGVIRLFKSHNPDFADGEQKRDFVYVADVVDVCVAFASGELKSGIYNVGTGEARTFLDLAHGVFQGLGRPEKIEFIPTPEKLRPAYQYFTQADLSRLRAAGYTRAFTKLEEGIKEYLAIEDSWKGRL